MGWEWRCFFVPKEGADSVLRCDGSPEQRTDVYLPNSSRCGVKERGGDASSIEVKTRAGHMFDDTGFEKWSKAVVPAVRLAQMLETSKHAQQLSRQGGRVMPSRGAVCIWRRSP